ncbi:hypothetical protein M422DRAFT_226325 [Sphaerobolus stellatus SS14]|nr:hypothetical protein M422DRAFT_226325 [Sphaerobolus stellatus SS14]
MTCSSCSSAVIRAMESVSGISSPSVDLIGNSGSIVVTSRGGAEVVRTEIEDAGFECTVVEIFQQGAAKPATTSERTVAIKIGGMNSQEAVNKVTNTLTDLAEKHSLTFTPIILPTSQTTVIYTPHPSSLTIRTIINAIISHGFTASAQAPTSLEDRAAVARLQEERYILLLVIISFIFAIPTFIVAVVGMSLLKGSNAFQIQLDTPPLDAQRHGATRWRCGFCARCLFALATPVQFGVGSFFYKRALKGVKSVWRTRRGDENMRKVWIERLFRWGSMDSLVVLGTSVGYFASLALMILDIRTAPIVGMMGGDMGWFDSTVFLMFFILSGRYIECLTKHRTSSAISALSSTLPSTGLLVSTEDGRPEEVSVILLEIGDAVLVPVGSSPPLDGIFAAKSPLASFTEASLTGEAAPVPKKSGDTVFAGTINAGPNAAIVTITSLPGHTMLDGIVGIVRDAMGRKAGAEKLADVLTGWFVPFFVGVAGITFGVWALRGYLGDLPTEFLDTRRGGSWTLFAVQFGVAVLVVACPCGIRLAGPTAQMVGIGLAVQHGVLSNGGGEAFYALSSGVDAVVMDKTGTITEGKVCVGTEDVKLFLNSQDGGKAQADIVSMLRSVENASTHPVAVGVREWCDTQLGRLPGHFIPSVELVSSEEIPGRGLVAWLLVKTITFNNTLKGLGSEETFVLDPGDASNSISSATLKTWQMAGKSVVLISAKLSSSLTGNGTSLSTILLKDKHLIVAQLGAHDPPRAEAATFIAELRRLGIQPWMLTGDNETTARSVAQSVGIESRFVIASALPEDKQNWVKRVQAGELDASTSVSKKTQAPTDLKRKLVAFIGDGINDAPALAQADVSLAMGSGLSIALSTASFTLLSRTTPLLSFLTIHHIARITRRKILTNFMWACVYNVCLVPLAAGAFYQIGDKRITLPPVWASASMALSSISVVINSLFLRFRFKEPAVVRKWRNEETAGSV